MSLNIAGSPRYLGYSTNNPSITGAIKSYRMYNTNSATCSVAEITSTNTTIKDCMKMNNRTMDKTQIGQNSTIATIPEENGKNNFDTDEASTSKCGIKLVMMTENEIKNSKLSPVITRKKLRSLKIKEFNDVISCYLCRGYLINPTTIDCCIHSYCRSCIVKHLRDHKYCPQCKENKIEINLSNIKSDDILKAVVYKLIPGLYQKECEKHLQFNNDNKITDLTDINEEEEYFSPVEPISLSLEYHPVSLEESNSNDKIGPQVRYLQCPAAVTVHHLKRFICSKFGIDPKNDKIEINIIYDDEILPEYFSLMDIAYSFKWKRIEPMKFYYQILIHSNKTYEIDCKKQSTEIKNEANSSIKRICSVNIQKCVRFKDDIDIKEDDVQNKIVPTTPIDKISNNNNDNHNNLEQERITNNDNKQNQNIILKKDKKQLTKNNLKNKNTELQTTIVQNKNDENIKISISSSSAQNNNSSDFKSLRSNDVRYDFSSSSSSAISTNGNSKTTKTNATTTKITNNIQNNKQISNLDFEISQKPVSKCDIVVSIPQAHIHRASNSSDDSFENLSLAQLKTANKKGAVSPREHTDSIEQHQKHDIPKIKIDLPSLKTKFTVPKRVATNDSNSETKKNAKNRKLSIEEPQPSTHEVDLTTYAKVIGLKPINPLPDIKRDLNPKNSPDASPASGTSSSGASSVFAFNSEISSTTSHKKRKKGKHSKQSKDGKRRKLHAEISSQPADESLKFKLKLTGNHKMHKSDRKVIDDSANVSAVEAKATDEVVVSSNNKKKPDVQINEIVEKKVQLNKNNIENIQNKQLEIISNQNTSNQNGINQKEVINNKITNSAQYTGNNKIRITTTTSSTINNNNTNSPKYIPTTTISSTSIPPVISVPPTPSIPTTASPPVPVDGNSVKSISLSNEVLTKSLPQKLLSMHQGPNLPVSPPLPPSLFKTTPMTLQTITTTATKLAPIQPRMPLHSDIRHQMHMQNMHRKGINNRTTAANFIVPNPPRGIASSAPKSYPINSIASAAHRQAAQFKRSASLDSSPPTLTKQLKQEQDRLIRKAAHASMAFQPTVNTFQKTGNQINMNTTPRRLSPPVSIVGTVGNNNNNTMTTPSIEQFYYTSSAYTHENITTTRPILIPPSSVSVTKMTETFAPGVNHPSGLTITPQLHNQQSTPFQFPQSNKPALEIVRILSNIPPADQQKLLVTNNNTIKQNIPTKTTRPPPPPIPLVKIKRSMSQSQPIKSTNINVQQSQIAQINNNNSIEKKSTADIGDSKNNNTAVKLSDSPAQILDLSGKSSRSPSREKSNSPSSLTNSPKPIVQLIKDTSKCVTGNNLEAALSKLKQQQQNSSQYTTNSLAQQILNQQVLINNNNHTNNKSNDDKTKQTTNNNDNSTNSCLQNLQLLSESATNREKIIINTQQQRTLPKLPKLNEISKMRGNATVRQQNASIRNIPNPSALVFRNNQQMPMLASITKTSASITPPKLNTISTNSTVISDLKIIDSNKICLTSSTITDPSKLIASKKNLNIEQLAANLNMRAAAAAGDNTNKNIETPSTTKLSATSTSVTTTSEQNNITVSSNNNTTSSSSSSSYTTIPLMAVSSTTTSPVTVVSSAS